MSSIFTKIINGDIPSHKIYEDERTYAFLDIFPVTKGHTLVVPKAEVDRFEDLAPEDYQALWATVQKVAKRIREVYNPLRVCIKIEGFDVAHAHVHVFACNSVEDFYAHPDRTKEPDHESLATIATELALQ